MSIFYLLELTLLQNLYLIIAILILFFFYELPYLIVILTGLFFHSINQTNNPYPKKPSTLPKVSCIITAYNEGYDLKKTIETLIEQLYPGHIEIIIVIDGANTNNETLSTAQILNVSNTHDKRSIIIVPKWPRGGKVSSINAGLDKSSGEIIINMDADTSFDNDVVKSLVLLFENTNISATSGSLRVRNRHINPLTRMQAIEYMIAIQGGKTGLSYWNLLYSISGAFGAFRKPLLMKLGGWDTHSGEDLDITIRIKKLSVRNPASRIAFADNAVGYTKVPESIPALIRQRIRWDGDVLFLFYRKHWQSFSPKIIGIKNTIFSFLCIFIPNIVLPIVQCISIILLCIMTPNHLISSVFTFIYLFYLLIVFVYITLVIISTKPRNNDIFLIIYLPFYPFYVAFLRFISVYALINELLFHSHQDSNLAPWWVIKRGRRF